MWVFSSKPTVPGHLPFSNIPCWATSLLILGWRRERRSNFLHYTLLPAAQGEPGVPGAHVPCSLLPQGQLLTRELGGRGGLVTYL